MAGNKGSNQMQYSHKNKIQVQWNNMLLQSKYNDIWCSSIYEILNVLTENINHTSYVQNIIIKKSTFMVISWVGSDWETKVIKWGLLIKSSSLILLGSSNHIPHWAIRLMMMSSAALSLVIQLHLQPSQEARQKDPFLPLMTC